MRPPGGNLRPVPLAKVSQKRLEAVRAGTASTGLSPVSTGRLEALRGKRLDRWVPLQRAGADPARKSAATRGEPIPRVSKKRAAENRERAALIKQLYPERPRCVRPGCPRLADDIHENLSRARSGGVITDPDMWRPLCRRCHDEITFRPESELQWAYAAGLLVHSWTATGGAA